MTYEALSRKATAAFASLFVTAIVLATAIAPANHGAILPGAIA